MMLSVTCTANHQDMSVEFLQYEVSLFIIFSGLFLHFYYDKLKHRPLQKILR